MKIIDLHFTREPIEIRLVLDGEVAEDEAVHEALASLARKVTAAANAAECGIDLDVGFDCKVRVGDVELKLFFLEFAGSISGARAMIFDSTNLDDHRYFFAIKNEFTHKWSFIPVAVIVEEDDADPTYIYGYYILGISPTYQLFGSD